MVYWQQFEASEWHIEYDAAKLAAHGVSDWEAEEVSGTALSHDQTGKNMVQTATSLLDEPMVEGRCS